MKIPTPDAVRNEKDDVPQSGKFSFRLANHIFSYESIKFNNTFPISPSVVARSILVALILVAVSLNLHFLPIDATTDVKWKTFKEKDGLFTMKYPSNWFPSNAVDEEYPSLLDMTFTYTGGGRSDVATLSIIADESVFTNVTDLMDSFGQSVGSEFDIVQPAECSKYTLKGEQACSIISTYKQTELPGNPRVQEMDILSIDEFGVQYILIYGATKNLFDDFLPVAEEMIKSFNSDNILSPDNESNLADDDIPELPPLSNSNSARL